ncbi:SLC13 family permease [Halobacillus sp. A5]|uniref:SLC13 family permease n=1 Tax=Halobacillus sp. A5 TaxID=2880263 RepID=UPI0020A6BC66|nr:SLC13 family permease [Halobacillus sp. A5]MCP3028404.1 SLC13 family permease [Halobacillus sp. A5]
MPTAFVTLVLIGMFVVLIKQWASPDITLFVTMAVFLLSGIITIEEAFRGFSHVSVIIIALLFIIGHSIYKTGILFFILQRCLQPNDRPAALLCKIMTPVAFMSAFMNNTPIVSILTPELSHWAVKNNLPPSKLLIPLSYAAILGGTMTLYGSSTNLIVHGLLVENGHDGFSVFEFALIGIPLTLAGVLYMSLTGRKLLPSRRTRCSIKENTAVKEKLSKRQRGIVFSIIIIMIILVSLHLVSLVKAALAVVIILLVTKILRMEEARKAVSGSVILIMASAIGIGTALENAGITAWITDMVLHSYPFIGLAGVTFLLYLATMILTEISHNIAAAVLMFPVGLSVANLIGADPELFAMTIAISASCSFMTPIGYQTNIIVFEPGGYLFKDFSKVGFGLSLICALCTVGIVLLIWR